MAQEERTIYVYENWRGELPSLLGRLRCGFVRGQETFSFEYDPVWLASADSSFSLDPDLALYRGRQYCLLYTSPSPRDGLLSRMPSSA